MDLYNLLLDKFPAVKRCDKRLCLDVTLEDLESISSSLKFEFSFISLLDIICFDKIRERGGFDLSYQLINYEHFEVINVTTFIKEGEIAPSIADIWKNTKGLELEIQDHFGIKFSNCVEERIFNHHDFIGHPLRKDFSPALFDYMTHSDIGFNRPSNDLGAMKETEWLNIGPYHTATDSGMRLMTQLHGEEIKSVYTEIGFTHKGIEKKFESLSFKQLAVSSHMMDVPYPETFSILLVDCIESFFGVDIPERAKVIRIFLLELERIVSHLNSLNRLALYLKGEMLMASISNAREIIQEMNLKLFGCRSSSGAIRLGGVVDIFKSTSIFDLFESIKQLSASISSVRKLFYSLDSWMHNLDDLTLSGPDAVEWGMSGPVLRASGINWDLRKRHPHYFYNDLEFAVPCGVEGNSYDRYVVRVEEISQSISILEQLLDYIPSGDLIANLDNIDFSKTGRFTNALEGPNGIVSTTMEFNGSDTPERVKLRPSTFPMCLALEEVLVGKELFDSLIGMISLNIIPAEVDR